MHTDHAARTAEMDLTRQQQSGATQGQRPPFPKRAVVTAGMPYGNKQLHFGHVGGMLVHADVFARFLRDRLGPENVIFVSGTDCYGSAVELSHAALLAEGAFTGTLEEYVAMHHEGQRRTLDRYLIAPDLYAASALGEAGRIHRQVSAEVFNRLLAAGMLTQRESLQFYDEAEGVFLNGRQVRGRCPIQGCKSEYAYADECALGHQFSPEELIAPVSAVSGNTPRLRPVRNWFFDLPRFRPQLEALVAAWRDRTDIRPYLISVVEEFLRPPMIYVKKDAMDAVVALGDALPPYTVEGDPQKQSDALVFATLEDRATAAAALDSRHIRYRTGKTLVPFRLSGNVDWGIPVPEAEGAGGLTFWVWPESLWAPISFTMACLQARGLPASAWTDWWASEDAGVYQFIGEDNIYFYAVAQMGMTLALAENAPAVRPTTVVPNRHILYRRRKASSSSADKPPMADDLLAAYTPEQLRMHFFHLNLAQNSASFEPGGANERGGYDPVLYEGNLLTNIYNRLVRSCFYTAQKYFDGKVPNTPASVQALAEGEAVILAYEDAMARFAFGKVVDLLDAYLREANKQWAAGTKAADQAEDQDARAQLLADAFHVVRVAATLLHPLAPEGTERVRDYLQASPALWDWRHIFEPLPFFFGEGHALRTLAPRVDFFSKTAAQLEG